METDRELIELIKRTLDSYEEKYIPGSWENFSNKQKKRKRTIFWRFGTGMAASLMVGWVALNVYQSMYNNHPENNKKQMVNTESRINTSEKNDTIRASYMNSSVSKKKDNMIAKNFSSINLESIKKTTAQFENSNPKNTFVFKAGIILPKANKDSVNHHILTSQNLPDTANKYFEPTTRPMDTINIASNTKKTSDSIRKEPVAESLNSQPDGNNQKIITVSKRKVRFGINFSPGVNATQTATSISFSGGINTDIALYSDFQLSTGLQIEYQSVVNNGSSKNSVPANQNRADLINLDLPLNITWKFFSNKTKSYYFSGGISSLAYLDEKYKNTTYTQQLIEITTMEGGHEVITYKVVNTASTVQNTVSPFHTFDFAGRVNIIFGLEQRLSPKLFLHIEPYLKIPISGLSTENLKFTTSGITCKISF